MGFDLGIQEIRQRLDGNVYAEPLFFPKYAEPEVKYLSNIGKQAFTNVLVSLPPLNFRPDGTPDSPIFLIDSKYHDQPWVLANFALDTPHAHVARYGEQLRQRFATMVDSEGLRVGISTVTVKDLVSKATSSMRKEVEFHPQSIVAGLAEFMEEKKDTLLQFYSELPPESYRVQAPFLTSRGSYFIGVYVEAHAAIVVCEVCNDEILNFCPHFNPTDGGKPSYEWEAEGKAIFRLNHNNANGVVRASFNTSANPNAIFFEAEKIINAEILAASGHSLVPSTASKQERAITAVTHYYNAIVSEDKLNRLSHARETASPRFPNMARLNTIAGGQLYALNQDVTMSNIAASKGFNKLAGLIPRMTRSHDLIKPGIIKHVPYETVKSDKYELIRLASRSGCGQASVTRQLRHG